MSLNGFGLGEIILIAMLVLIVFGPRRLPEITRTIGKGIREFRKGMNEIQRELEAAGRETQWQSPPAPPKPAAAASSATIAGTAVAAGEGPADDDAGADEGAAEDGTDETAAAVVDEQTPPVPRDMVDPAEEFIDPWSTDSSRPNFAPKPRPEPLIAPPTTEPADAPPAAADEDAPKD
ncbi:Sec-independent protein translocase subunit TatA/TatB [Candidatus Palauibacter sp.]|uniref:Sec-independent protein translocase subunit TatA/TatB n=1 Tax=Candidatus Palauibacter sp. TaxID=3101350 RepID=UPI003B0150E7